MKCKTNVAVDWRESNPRAKKEQTNKDEDMTNIHRIVNGFWRGNSWLVSFDWILVFRTECLINFSWGKKLCAPQNQWAFYGWHHHRKCDSHLHFVPDKINFISICMHTNERMTKISYTRECVCPSNSVCACKSLSLLLVLLLSLCCCTMLGFNLVKWTHPQMSCLARAHNLFYTCHFIHSQLEFAIV